MSCLLIQKCTFEICFLRYFVCILKEKIYKYIKLILELDLSTLDDNFHSILTFTARVKFLSKTKQSSGLSKAVHTLLLNLNLAEVLTRVVSADL